MFIYNRIDSVMIERMLENGAVQAGIYAQGFRYLDAVNMFALLFAGILLPVYARLIKQKKNVFKMVELPFRILLSVSLLAGITCYFNANTIMEWVYVSHIVESSESFSILILSFIPISMTYIFGTLLTANGNLKYLNWMAIFGVLLNVVLNIVLIPKLMSYGAATATLITQSLTAIVQLVIAYKVFKFPINYKLYLSMAWFAFFIIVLNHPLTTSYFSLPSSTWGILFKLFVGTVFIFVLKILKFSHFLTLLNLSKK